MICTRKATRRRRADPTGRSRRRRLDRGNALDGESTLNRLELTPVGANAASRYKKIISRTCDVERLLASLFLQAHLTPPARIAHDVDATDDPIHGHQLGRFVHAYYKNYFLGVRICSVHSSGPQTSTPAPSR